MPRLMILRIPILLFFGALLASPGAAQPVVPDTPPQKACRTNQPFCNNEWEAIAANGTKFWMVQWAVESPENVVTLRIPFEVVEPIGRAGCSSIFGSEYRDPNCQQSYATSLVLRAVLPDLTPYPKMRASTENEEDNAISIILVSQIWALPKTSLSEKFVEYSKFHRHMLTTGQNRIFPIVEKENRFDLKRVGPDHNKYGYAAVSLKDFLYDGPDIDASSNVIVCTVEEVPTRDVDPNAKARPSCQHYFMDQTLTAYIQLNYKRQNLKNWKNIRKEVTRLISNLRKSN